MTTPTILAALDTFQQAANRGTAVYLSPELVQELRDALKAEPDADALAARPLLEEVAAMADCIGAQTVGQITAISNRAAAWLRENPPGQPVAIEPRGCPTLRACSCVEPTPLAPVPGEVRRLVAWLNMIAQHLVDKNLSGAPPCRRAAILLEQQESELAALRGVPVAMSERPWERPGWCDEQGRCWFCNAYSMGRWTYDPAPDPEQDWGRLSTLTHSLPHWAIQRPRATPLPAPQAGEGEA